MAGKLDKNMKKPLFDNESTFFSFSLHVSALCGQPVWMDEVRTYCSS